MVGIALLLSFSGPVWYNKRAYRAYLCLWGLLRLARPGVAALGRVFILYSLTLYAGILELHSIPLRGEWPPVVPFH